MNSTETLVRSEDPPEWTCGNEQESHTRSMKYDGNLATILTWRTVGSIEGDNLGWRFITTEGRTVAVRPVQLPSNTRPFCIPTEINSALRAASWLIGLAHGRVSVSGVDPHAPDKADRLREIALYEINAFIGQTTDKKVVAIPEPRKGGGYTAKQRAAIVKQLTDTKDPGAAKLEMIRDFIAYDLFNDLGAEIKEALRSETAPAERKPCPPPGGFARAIIRDADLRRLVCFMGKQIGRDDMPLRVLLDYNSAMPEMFAGWVKETAKARKIKPAEAERFLAAHVTFIAECEGRRFRHCYPIEDIAAEADVMDQEDRAPHHIPVRHESANAISTGGHATYTPNSKPPKAKGRPPATKEQRANDERLVAKWHASGERLISVFAEKEGIDQNELRRAINSDAHRKARKVVVKPS